MAETREGAESEQHYISVMGPELGALFQRCWNECAWLHIKWKEFVILYGTSQDRIDLLNQAAPAFFASLQGALWESVILQLCRITDPRQSAGNSNLTVQRLPELVADELKPAVDSALTELKEAREFAVQLRNLQIGHNDLAVAMGHANARPLPSASRADFQRALRLLSSLLNLVQKHYDKGSAGTQFEAAIPSLGNAEALLYTLRDGLDAEAERRRLIQLREPLPRHLGYKGPV